MSTSTNGYFITRLHLSLISSSYVVLVMVYYSALCAASIHHDTLEKVEFYAEFSDQSSSTLLEFTTMAVEQEYTKQIYIGARNRLYQLDDDLGSFISVETGPVDDTSFCRKYQSNCKGSKNADNLNKLLVIDYDNNRIITCGNVNEGICHLRMQGNIQLRLDKLNISSIAGSQLVAAPNALSTIGFIARSAGNASIFVGSSKTIKDRPQDYFDKPFYAISRRLLFDNSEEKDMFASIFYNNLATAWDDVGVAVDTDKALQNFRVTFVDGFATAETAFFIMTHPSANSNPPYREEEDSTYVAQICLNEKTMSFRSYMELRLECDFNGARYTKAVASRTVVVGNHLAAQLGIQSNGDSVKVVIISFVQSSGSSESAICLFSLPDLQNQFLQLVKRCMRTDNSRRSTLGAIDWLETSGTKPCGNGNFDNLQNPICNNQGIWDVVSFLKDKHSVFTKNAVYVTDSTVISAIEVTSSEEKNHTVAFFGTQNGKVIKFRLDSEDMDNVANTEIETIVINQASDGSNSDLLGVKSIQLGFTGHGNLRRVYVMTPIKVVGLPLFNCSRHTDCAACLGSGDPFCGWCTLESRCSAAGECRSVSSDSYEYINIDGECPRLASKQPLMLSLSESNSKSVLLEGYNIPNRKNDYECSFGNFYRTLPDISRRLSYYEIKCKCPSPGTIPKYALAQGYFVVPLSLIYHGEVVASTRFTFYNCSVHKLCMSCVNTTYNCTWCINDNKCSDEPQTECHPQAHVNQVGNCPQLTLLPSGNSKIYLASKTGRTIRLPAKQLPDDWKKFKCLIEYQDGRSTQEFNGRKSGPVIECNQVVGALPVGIRSSEATVRVVTDGTKPNRMEIDNPFDLTVEIYRCDLGKDANCGVCLQSPNTWQCDWCETTKHCQNRGTNCDDLLDASSGMPCKNPRILDFSPSSAPFGGKSTTLKLKGVNFGFNSNMVIDIGGVRCDVQESNCCEAECIPNAKSVISDNISLCITLNSVSRCLASVGYSTISTKAFSFVDPVVTSFSPDRGLKHWGTRVTLHGEHLDTGNNVSVNMGGVPCFVDKSTLSASTLECQLQCGKSSSRRKRDVADSVLHTLYRGTRATTPARVMLDFDGVSRTANNGYFQFVDDVEILSVTPIATIRSGGLPLMFKGTNLNLIQYPQIKITLHSTDYRDTCKHVTDGISCTSPDLSQSPVFKNVENVYVAVALESRGCDMSVKYELEKLHYTPNPSLDLFVGHDSAKIFRNEPIYITGKNLCPDRNFCKSDTVTVFIGDDMYCSVTRLDVDQITCSPDVGKPGTHEVKVLIGGYMSPEIGHLEYKEEGQFSSAIVGVVIAVVSLVVLLVLALVYFYRRRANERSIEVKNMEIQMNLMESKVAKVCKEAFAELQTDMSELDNVGGGGRIPYLQYRFYLMRVLFPDPLMSENQHALLLSGDRGDNRTNSHRLPRPRTLGMDRFNKLLENKVFLISFIKALEGNRAFTMKERATVGGLILIVLQDRLVYATEILEHLLADLIEKSLESNNHPKLLLRRTDSVAEKMLTHWFSILLHTFLMECAGEPLFTLYRVIKQQIDKGPVDAITKETRYSLSEDKLLRQTIDHEPLTLVVNNYLADFDQPDFNVKVLSCDSVSQAKRKILDVAYMNVHYTQRPTPDDIDIEWHNQKGSGRVILRDEDDNSKVEGDWKQINTLDYYTVQNNDRISILPKKDPSLVNHSAISTASKSSELKRNGSGARLLPADGSNSSLPRHKQPYRSETSTLQRDVPRLYHLVKPSDQDQKEGADRVGNMVSEVYLTRLLTTKGTIQKYVDDLFETIFSVVQRGHALPIAIKHMFDFLDHQAHIHGITDPEIVHTWKSNCLPLRFWVNLIKNPEFVYDIHKSPIVDCYLSVIAQAFMDSCSIAEYKLGKDSPSNKLLYAKEIPEYRQWVDRYYAEISKRPRLNPRDLSMFLQEESFVHSHDFNSEAALSQLYSFVVRYNDDILKFLDTDPEARRQNLARQFEYVSVTMNGEPV